MTEGSVAPAASVRSAGQPGPGFWVAMGLGAAVTVFGVIGLLGAEGNGLGSFIPWFVGGALVLDLLVVPVAAGIGLLARRVVPAPAWPAVRTALIATATLVAFAAPLALDLGGTPGNPSLRPRDYGGGLLVALAVVWGLAAVVGGTALARARRVGAAATRDRP